MSIDNSDLNSLLIQVAQAARQPPFILLISDLARYIIRGQYVPGSVWFCDICDVCGSAYDTPAADIEVEHFLTSGCRGGIRVRRIECLKDLMEDNDAISVP